MFLIRTFFWVSLVILLVPLGNNNSANVVGATKYAFRDMNQFCNRNVDICNISQEAWRTIKYKAEYGYNIVVAVAKDMKESSQKDYKPTYSPKSDAKSEEWRTGSIEKQSAKTKVSSKIEGQNTLNAADMEPEWRVASN